MCVRQLAMFRNFCKLKWVGARVSGGKAAHSAVRQRKLSGAK